jgi:hypothetical protein
MGSAHSVVKKRVATETEAVCVRGRKRVPQASLPEPE